MFKPGHNQISVYSSSYEMFVVMILYTDRNFGKSE